MKIFFYCSLSLLINIILIQVKFVHSEEYQGSQAYSYMKPSYASVNAATGTFDFSYPLIHNMGFRENLNININYRYNAKGMFGLPDGWSLDIDYISGKTAVLNGKQWIIDPLWHDETGYGSGLKYYNQKGSSFIEMGADRETPIKDGNLYRYKLMHKDGSIKYFSSQGLLILIEDRFGNAITFTYQKPIEKIEKARIKSIIDNYGNQYRFSYEPNTLVITNPDYTQQRIYFNETGIKSIVNPLNHSYQFSYLNNAKNKHLISAIEAPEGLITALKYDSILFLDGTQAKELPVVISFKQYDKTSHKIHKAINYGYSKGNNYTGYPFYAMSHDGDSLIDSNNQLFRYSVSMKNSSGSSNTKEVQHQDYFYNYLHLPVEILTYHEGLPHLKTLYEYDISPFKYSRSTNYDKPIKSTSFVWSQSTLEYIPSNKTVNSYDNYGNKLSEEKWIYNRDESQWVLQDSERFSYFVDGFSLLSESVHIDKITGKSIRKRYRLSESKKTHSELAITYKDNEDDGVWQPWKKLAFVYDDKGRKISSTLSWEASGKKGVQSVTHQTHYLFNPDKSEMMIQYVSPMGNTRLQITDVRNGNVLKKVLPLGETFIYSYNALGQVLTESNPKGYVASTHYGTYQSDGVNSVTHESPMGYKRRKLFDASGREVELQDFHNNRWRMLSKTDFNAWDKIVKKTNKLGLETRIDYDQQKRPDCIVDYWKNKTVIEYDDEHLMTTTYFNDHKVQEAYKIPWLSKSIKSTFPVFSNPNDQQDSYIEDTHLYSGFGHLLNVSSSLVSIQTQKKFDTIAYQYGYDASFNKIKTDIIGFDGLTLKRRIDFDLMNNKTTFQKEVYNNKEHFFHQGFDHEYDSDSRLIRSQSPNIDGHSGFMTQYFYDKNGQHIKTVLPDEHSIEYSYDRLGQLVHTRWFRHQAPYNIVHQYDADGHLIATNDSENKTLYYQYTLNGLLSNITYPGGRKLVYDYDRYDRIINQKDVNDFTQKFIYRLKDKGNLSTIEANDRSINFYYGVDSNNVKGKLVRQENRFDKWDNTDIQYTYNPYGLLANSIFETTEGETAYEVAYSYQPRGELMSQTMKVKYNDDHHEQSIHFYYDAFKRLTEEQHTHDKTGIQQHWHYQYDGNNNLIEEMFDSPNYKDTIKRHYNAADQLVSIEKNGGSIMDIIHDTNGRLYKDAQGKEYHYDDANFLLSINDNDSAPINFDYFPNGLLSKAGSENDHVFFFYDKYKHVITEKNDCYWTSFIRNGSDLLASTKDDTNQQFFKANQSTGATLSDGRLSVNDYQGYGKKIEKQGRKSTTNFGWNQEYTEPDSGLVYLRQRFYNPELRRFITEDSVDTDNRYAYAQANPITNIDPTGQSSQQALNYGMGASFVALGIVGAILAVPTAGASMMTVSSTFAVSAGVTAAFSGASLVGSQAALDSGNKAAADALQYTSIALGVLSGIEDIVALAPRIMRSVGIESHYLTRYMRYLPHSKYEIDSYLGLARQYNETVGTMATAETTYSRWEIEEYIDIAHNSKSLIRAVDEWNSVWQTTTKSVAGYSEEQGFSYFFPSRRSLTTPAFGKQTYLPKNLAQKAMAPTTLRSKIAYAAIDKQVKHFGHQLTESMEGGHDMAKQWFKQNRSLYGELSTIDEDH